jgi:hypothetical protein
MWPFALFFFTGGAVFQDTENAWCEFLRIPGEKTPNHQLAKILTPS